jgi:hypothetical protein
LESPGSKHPLGASPPPEQAPRIKAPASKPITSLFIILFPPLDNINYIVSITMPGKNIEKTALYGKKSEYY